MKGHAALLVGLLLLPLPASTGGRDIEVDSQVSQVGFTLRTRWGQSLEGRFPAFTGKVAAMPDARRQVRLVLAAREVEIVDNPRYSRLTRGEGFFDVQRHPEVEFVSEHFPPALMREGGELSGILSIRGVRRHERFAVAPAGCARPLIDCPVEVVGDVSRSDYAMDRWALALSDRVQFRLSLRGDEATP